MIQCKPFYAQEIYAQGQEKTSVFQDLVCVLAQCLVARYFDHRLRKKADQKHSNLVPTKVFELTE